MLKRLFYTFSALALTFSSLFVKAQCTVTASASPTSILCGDSVLLSAILDNFQVAFRNNFNCGSVNCPADYPTNPNGNFGTWSNSSTAQFNNPCTPTTATPHIWFNQGSPAPRQLATQNIDTRAGGVVRFQMRFADPDNDGNNPPCENPDESDEGVSLQWSNDNGANWFDLAIYDPGDGNDPVRTVWTTYTVPIAGGAIGTSIRFRWIQHSNTQDLLSGAYLDHWGLDNVEVLLNQGSPTFTWAHTNITKTDATTPAVSPTTNTSYTVTCKDGPNTCTSTVNVTVVKPTVTASANPLTICSGQTSTLNGEVKIDPPLITCSTAFPGCRVDPPRVTTTVNGTTTASSNNFKDFSSTQSLTGKMQIIYTAAELTAMGIKPGKITEIGINVLTLSTGTNQLNYMANFRIGMKCTGTDVFETSGTFRAQEAGAVNVYSRAQQPVSIGWNYYTLDKAYAWDGTTNLLFEFCYLQPTPASGFGFITFSHQANVIPQYRFMSNSTNSNSTNYCNNPGNMWCEQNRTILKLKMCEPYTPPADYIWTPDDGTFNPGTTSKTPTVSPTTTTTYTLNAKLQGAPAGCNSSASVTVNVVNVGNFNPTIEPVCAGGIMRLHANIAGMTSYSWTGPGGYTATGSDPTRAASTVAMSGTYTCTINVNNGACTVSKNVNITVDTPPADGRGYTDSICENNTSYTLFTKLTNAPQPGGTWTADPNGPNPLNGTIGISGGTIDGTKLAPPGPGYGTYRFKYTVTNNNACGSRDTIVFIKVKARNFPGVDSSFTICNSGNNVDLDTCLGHGNPRKNITTGGTWTDINTPNVGGRFTAPTGLFNINALAPGNYRFKYKVAQTIAGSNSNPCLADSAVVTVVVTDRPFAGRDTLLIRCNSATTEDLFTRLPGGAQPGGGWTDVSTPASAGSAFDPLSGILAENGMPAGNYRFRYIIALSGCLNDTAFVNLTINNQNIAGSDSSVTLCNSTVPPINLKSALKNGLPPSSGGTWTDINTPVLTAGRFNSGAATVNINGLAAGAYRFKYKVASSAPCLADSAVFTINVEAPPYPGKGYSDVICQTNATYDLFAGLTSGPLAGGTWTSTPAHTPVGTPGLTGGNNLDGTQLTPGIYKFTYTVTANNTCGTRDTVANITVEKQPFAGGDSSFASCNNAGTSPINLFNHLKKGPSNQNPDAGGTWTDISTTSAGAAFNAAGGTLNPAGLTPGNYRFKYTVAPGSKCPGDDATIFVNVISNPTTGSPGSRTVCNDAGNVDLFTVITGTYDAGGTWSPVAPTNGTYLAGNLFTPFSAPATSYTYRYTIAVAGCPASSNTVTVTVNRRPNAGTNGDTTVCESSAPINIFKVLDGSPQSGGSWTNLADASTPAVPFPVTGKGGQSFDFQYRMVGSAVCPDSTAVAKLTVIHQPVAGNDVSNAKICFNGTTINLFNLLAGSPETTGSWQKVGSFNGTLNATTGDFTPTGLPSDTGAVNFIYVVNGTVPCINDTAKVSLRINGAPVISNLVTTCSTDRSTYTATFNISGGERSTYAVVPSGTITGASSPYTYTSAAITNATGESFTVSDGNGCASDNTSVFKDCSCTTVNGAMDLTPQSLCFGEQTSASLYDGTSFVNDGNDVVTFYLHEGSGTNLSNIKATSTTPVFGFVPGMSYETTYYVSCAAGNDSSGYAAKNDVCFQVAPGTPVVFHPLPLATLSGSKNICPGTATDLSLSFTAGTAPYRVGIWNSVSNQTDTTGGLGAEPDNTISVNPIDTTQYELRYIEDNYGCETSYPSSAAVSINVNVAPRATITPGNLCSDGNSAPGTFTVNFSGAGSTFMVRYKNSLDGSQTTINNINSSSVVVTPPFYDKDQLITYTLDSVADNSGSVCPGVPNGQINIYPIPDAILSGNQTICSSDQVQLHFDLSGVGPWEVVFNDGVNPDQTVNITQRSFDHLVANPGAGVYNYSIVSVTDKAAGGPSCLASGQGSALVAINSVPKVSLRIEDPSTGNRVKNDQYCETTTPKKLVFALDPASGFGNKFRVRYRVNSGAINTIIVSRPDTSVTVAPAPGLTSYNFVSIEDLSSAQCPGTGDSATIRVNPTPKINSATPAAQTICLGSQTNVSVNLSGNPVLKYTFKGSGADTATYNVTGSNTFTVRPVFAGVATYTLTAVSDGSNPTCSGATGLTFTVNVNPAPSAQFTSPNMEVCQGTPVTLRYQLTGNGTMDGTFSDSSTTTIRNVTNQAAGVYTTTLNLAPGTYKFSFTTVVDKSPAACPGTVGPGTTRVVVRPTPQVTALALDASPICKGTADSLRFTVTGNGPFSILYTDNLGTSYPALTGVNGAKKVRIPSDTTRTFRVIQITDNSQAGTPAMGCWSPDTDTITLRVNPLPYGYMLGAREVCEGLSDSVQMRLFGNGPFTVSFTDGVKNFTTQAPAGLFTYPISPRPLDSSKYYNLTILDASNPQCAGQGWDTAYIHINPIPRPDFTQNKKGGCSPLAVNFTNIPEVNYTSQSCVWDFGDGSPLFDSCGGASHTFYDVSIYKVTLTITSQQGCVGDTTKTVTVYPDPVADFRWEPEPVTMTDSYVRFFNNSFGGAKYEWNIDSVGTFTEYAPNVQFPADEEGTYQVCLKVTTGFGCVDTICKDLLVKGEVLINIPNSFTPNGDGYNEEWLPIVLGERVDMYELTVFDRWGHVLFHTNDPTQPWNGHNLQNEPVQLGVYAYRIDYRSRYSGEKLRKIGNINLIK